MDLLNSAVGTINDFLWTYIIIVVLVGCGLWFTLSTKLVDCAHCQRWCAFSRVTSVAARARRSFQAFCVSTASRVGVGNIAGVAIADRRASTARCSGCGRLPLSGRRRSSWRARSRRSTRFRADMGSFTAYLLHPECSWSARRGKALCRVDLCDVRSDLRLGAGEYDCALGGRLSAWRRGSWASSSRSRRHS